MGLGAFSVVIFSIKKSFFLVGINYYLWDNSNQLTPPYRRI
jgi:hypothetical protein